MKWFKGDSFAELYYEMLEVASSEHVQIADSRLGPVKDHGPAYYELSPQASRLAYLKERNINPFFALAEFASMVNGSNRLRPFQFFLSSYHKYSDDGETLHGAYGFRLRHYFGRDQLEDAIRLLADEPTTRRAVLTIWAPDDLVTNSKDLPCHTTIYLKIRHTALDLTALNRSNDVYFGVPYDILVFYLLQLYISERLGCEVGTQRHFVDSFHLYEINFKNVESILSANNKSTLARVATLLPHHDFQNFVRTNTEKIVSLEFGDIEDKTTRDFFNSYAVFEATRDFKTAVNLLPISTLGYAAYLWYRSKKEFPQNAEVEQYEALIRS
jgi:thymidylate synthase